MGCNSRTEAEHDRRATLPEGDKDHCTGTGTWTDYNDVTGTLLAKERKHPDVWFVRMDLPGYRVACLSNETALQLKKRELSETFSSETGSSETFSSETGSSETFSSE